MNISLLWRCTLNHRELLTRASIVTTVSFFSSITGIESQGAAAPFFLSNSYRPETKNKYKLLVYKLCQDLGKNKPFIHDDITIHSRNKNYLGMQLAFISYKSSFERAPIENHIDQSVLIKREKQSSLKCYLSLRNLNDRDFFNWRNMFNLTSYVDAVGHMLAYAKNILMSNKNYAHKKLVLGFALSDFISQVYDNTVQQHSQNLHNTDVDINKTFYHLVYL